MLAHVRLTPAKAEPAAQRSQDDLQDEAAAGRRLAEAKRPTHHAQPQKRALEDFDSNGDESISEVNY